MKNWNNNTFDADAVSISPDLFSTEDKSYTINVQPFGKKEFPFSDKEILQTTSGLAHSAYPPEQQNWSGGETLVLYARLIEVLDDAVTLECYIDDVEPAYIEERIFDRKLLEGAVPLKFGTLVIITFFQRSGYQATTFKPGKGIVKPEIFNVDHLFEGLENSPIAQKGHID